MAITRIGPNQSINLASNITGTLPVANGGTALTSGFLNGGTINDGTNSKSQIEVGTAMSYSSGIWTFPYTGQWQIVANLVGSQSQTTTYRGLKVLTTTNNSSYSSQVSGYTGQAASQYYMSSYYSIMFDVTDVSNCKVKVQTEMQATGGVSSLTWIEFFYLGDT